MLTFGKRIQGWLVVLLVVGLVYSGIVAVSYAGTTSVLKKLRPTRQIDKTTTGKEKFAEAEQELRKLMTENKDDTEVIDSYSMIFADKYTAKVSSSKMLKSFRDQTIKWIAKEKEERALAEDERTNYPYPLSPKQTAWMMHILEPSNPNPYTIVELYPNGKPAGK